MTKDTAETKEGVGQLIRAVLITHKNALTDGMPVAQLNNEYRELNAASIPFRELGYPSLMDLLISLQQSDDIVIGKRGSVQVVFPRINSKIAHVRALVANQKDSTRRHSRGGRKFTPRCNSKVAPPKPLKLGSQILADVLKLVRTKPNGIHVNKIVEYLADRNVHNIDNKSLKSQLFDVGHEVTIDYDMVYPVVKIHQTSQKTTSVLVPAGLSESDENEGWSSAKSSIGTNQENGMPEESQDVASPANENANVLSRDNENVPVATEDGIDMLVNKRTKFRLDKLIQQHPEGIWCADLPEYYKKEYRIPLNYEDLGFASVSDFAAHLPDIFHIVQLQEKGDFKLFNAKAPKPDTKETARQGRLSLAALHNVYQSYGDEDEPVPVTLSPATSQRLIPRGVMTYGETVPQIFVTELFPDNKDYVDVVVVDAITPTFFWIHLLKRTSKFRQFMAKLHEFYTENASKYVIPIVLLEKGLNCACIYDEKWHRAVIKTVKPDNSVTLMFYDYGTTMTYPPEAIHFLHRSFSALPAQAIPCGLYNVKPKYTEKWSYAECKKFVDKVLEVPLVAMLGTIDAENNSMLIGLTNTDGPTDIHINDWMVDTGYAIYGKMVCTRPPNYPFRRFLECACGRTTDKDKRASKSAKLIRSHANVEVPINSAPVPMEPDGNLSFYETLLRMHRKSACNSRKALVNANRIESVSSREKSRLLNPETSQVAKAIITDVVTPDVATINASTTDTIATQNGGDVSCSRGKSYRTNLLKKLAEAHANIFAAMNASSSDGASDERRSSSVSAQSGATSSSANVILPDCDGTNAKVKRVNETPQISKSARVPKRNANLLKSIAPSRSKSHDSNNPNAGEGITAKSNQETPLHLRSELQDRRKCATEFGTIHSIHGGHGRMEPIDWMSVRNTEISAGSATGNASREKPRKASDGTLPMGITSNTHFENLTRPIETFPRIRTEMAKPEENAAAKIHQETRKPEKKASIKRHREMPKPEERSSTERHREISKKDVKALMKRYQGLLKSKQTAPAMSNQEMPKPEEKASATILSATPKISSSTSVTSKLPPAKRAFLDFAIKSAAKQQALPEFGDFHSKFGGNGRMEPIAWNEHHKIVDSPAKVEASPEDSAKPAKQAPVALQPAGKGFSNIVNSLLPPANEREDMCVPEGNIGQQTNVSPLLRMIVRSVNTEQRNKQLRLFVPNNVAELLRNDKENDVSSDSSSYVFPEIKKSFVVDDGEMPMGSRINSSVKYQSLGRASTSVERSFSDTIPATTESESSPTNDTSGYLDSTNDASFIISANATKSAEELLRSFDNSVITSCESPTASCSDDSRDKTSRAAISESIVVVENVMDTKSEDTREKIARENAGERVDSVVREASRSRLQCLVTNNDTVSDGVSVSDCPVELSSPTAKQNTNATIQNASLKLNNTLLEKFFKFIGARRDSTDESSELDSDDVSHEEHTKEDDSQRLKSYAKEVGNPVNEGSGGSCDSDDVQSSFCQDFDSLSEKRDVATTLNEEKRVSDEKTTKFVTDKDNEELKDSVDFEKAEKPVCSKNTEDSSLGLVKRNPEYIPCYDDSGSDSDSDEWDYSPGFQSIEEQLRLKYASSCENIEKNSSPAIPENRLTWKNSNSHEDSAGDSSNDNDPSCSAQRSTMADGTSIFRGPSRPENDCTEKNQTIYCDKRSNPSDDSFKDDTDNTSNSESSKVSKQTPYSILSEIQKFNITAKAAGAFASISSSSSSGSSVERLRNCNAAKFLTSAVRRYL